MKTIILFLSIFALSMGPAYSQKKEENKVDILKQNFIKNIKEEDAFVSDNQSYALMSDIKAIKQNNLSSLGYQYQSTLLKMTTPYGEHKVVEQKGDFIVFEMKGVTISQLSDVEKEDIYPVVLNLRTQQYGILLDDFIVKVEDPGNAKQIAADHNLTVLKVFPRLNLVSFKNNKFDNVLDKFSNLKTDERIRSVNLEILEHIRVPL